ncbi:hypothetical protein BGZ73_000274 [Actinomortierella ambigua]|nr:hypothetical protein BGZ73_000274 [Actinomortierella ambigua]
MRRKFDSGVFRDLADGQRFILEETGVEVGKECIRKYLRQQGAMAYRKQKMPKSHFVDIPELVALLADYLTPSDLLTCVLLNKTWNRIFIPFLWRSIDDSAHSWPYILDHIASLDSSCALLSVAEDEPAVAPPVSSARSKSRPSDSNKDRDWLVSVVAKYGTHVRELKIERPLTLEAICRAGTCTNLQSLLVEWGLHARGPDIIYVPPQDGSTAVDRAELTRADLSTPMYPAHLSRDGCKLLGGYQDYTPESIKAKTEFDWMLAQHMWYLVRINPGLERIDTSKDTYTRHVVVSKDFLYDTMQSLVDIKHLRVSNVFSTNASFWKLWSSLPTTLETLEVGKCSVFPLPDPLPEPHPSLRVLSARGSTTLSGLFTFLGILPNLEELKLDSVTQDDTTPSTSGTHPLLPTPLPGKSLKKLDAAVDDWETVLRLLPNICIWITDEEVLDEDTALLLKTHCPGLEVVRARWQPWYIDECFTERPDSDPANQMLATHAKLREFNHIQHFIKVDEMLRQPWVCMGLEWLTCRIVGVDRLTAEEEAVYARVMQPSYGAELSAKETQVVEKFQRCRAQHHGVYDRLASLKRLKHLDLGYENRYPWTYKSGGAYQGEDGEEYLEYAGPTFDTLELTLESGLDRLAGLTNLEMFGFECLNHKIGKAELDWMGRSWPRLKLMYGLDRERLYRIEHCKKRAALREYFEAIRPDVVHDSLFEDNV